MIANFCDPIRDVYKLKPRASCEGIVSDVCKITTRKSNALKHFTAIERMIANFCDPIRNVYTLKLRASCECIVINACHVIGNVQIV